MKFGWLNMFLLLTTVFFFGGLLACSHTAATQDQATTSPQKSAKQKGAKMPEKITKTDEEWRRILTPDQYEIMRKKGTERAFTGKYWNHKGKGIYKCVACGLELFDADTKFDSGTGWPSFWKPVAKEHIEEETDRSFGMARTEVLCYRCGAHLGHVFPDGPRPTGLRYCINSVALQFEEKKKE